MFHDFSVLVMKCYTELDDNDEDADEEEEDEGSENDEEDELAEKLKATKI